MGIDEIDEMGQGVQDGSHGKVHADCADFLIDWGYTGLD